MLRVKSGIRQRKSPAFLAGKPGLSNQKTGRCSKWSRCEKSEGRACFCTSHKMTLANA